MDFLGVIKNLEYLLLVFVIVKYVCVFFLFNKVSFYNCNFFLKTGKIFFIDIILVDN